MRLQRGCRKDGVPATIDLTTGRPKTRAVGPRVIELLTMLWPVWSMGPSCPSSALQFAPALYYPSTLQLLGLAYIGEKHPECL